MMSALEGRRNSGAPSATTFIHTESGLESFEIYPYKYSRIYFSPRIRAACPKLFRDKPLKKRVIKRLALLLSSVVFSLALVLLLEGLTRILKPEINFQGTERSLLRERVYGETYGWQPNATGVCFGEKVYIDESGFRKISSPQGYKESWLILGDSVTFGVGVETKDTYAQLLQDDHPEARVWNTAVIGYDARNYRDVFYYLMADEKRLPNLKRVLLFFCLNDVDLDADLETALGKRPSKPQLAESVLSFLRQNSKLYILTKNTFSDRSKFYFTQDYQLYAGGSDNFTETVNILGEISGYLRDRNIDFTVVILPYEYQLRERNEQNLLPQKRLAASLAEKSISYIDAYDYFARQGDAKADYLYADFGHFSKKGQRVVFNFLKERLNASPTTASSGEATKTPSR
jgi:lysophospholipase L1-like esterase